MARAVVVLVESVGTWISSTYLARRLATAGLQLAAVMMTRTRIIQRYKLVKFTRFRCTSADLFFSCCGSAAASPKRPGHHDQVPAKNNKRRRGDRPRHHDQVPATHNGRRRGQRPGHHAQLPTQRRGQRSGATIKYLRRTTSAAAVSGLERWNLDIVSIYDAAARYCRATVGRSHDDARPDNSTPHTGKIYSSPLHISRFVLLLLRQSRGAEAAT